MRLIRLPARYLEQYARYAVNIVMSDIALLIIAITPAYADIFAVADMPLLLICHALRVIAVICYAP